MCQLKLRAWDKKNKEMTYFNLLEKDDNYCYRDGYLYICFDSAFVNITCKDIVVMQCTGLKDRDGNEIYEGDILDFDGELLEVYRHDCGDWRAGQYIIWMWINEEKKENNWKVVGNIYKDPELLHIP